MAFTVRVLRRLFKTARGRFYRMLFVIAGSEVRVLRVRGPGHPPLTPRDVAAPP